MLILLGLCVLFVGFVLVVPLMLLGLALRLAFGLAVIPLRIAGFAVKMTLGLALGLVALILAGAVLLIPLLPVLFLVAVIWMLVRLVRRQPGVGLAG